MYNNYMPKGFEGFQKGHTINNGKKLSKKTKKKMSNTHKKIDHYWLNTPEAIAKRKKYATNYYSRHKDKVKEYALKNKDRFSKRRKEYYEKNQDKLRNWHLVRKYNITIEQYNHLLTKQNGVCAICFNICSSGRSLSVDHNHNTGKVRGLLCTNCNQGIGCFKENVENMLSSIKYLNGHNY